MTEIVVDTDVISFGFRNDSRFTYYLPHMQGLRPLMSFMTLAEIEFGVQRRNWGQERRQQLEDYLNQYYSVIHSNRICLGGTPRRPRREWHCHK